jgi:hypothetical protein
MAKVKYWTWTGAAVLATIGAFAAILPQASLALGIPLEHTLAYAFILTGVSVFYFGIARPQWFTKQIIPPATPAKIPVKAFGKNDEKKVNYKFSLKDDSYFWRVFPYGLFFTFGGFAYLMQPNPLSILVALGCAIWVQFLYKFVE